MFNIEANQKYCASNQLNLNQALPPLGLCDTPLIEKSGEIQSLFRDLDKCLVRAENDLSGLVSKLQSVIAPRPADVSKDECEPVPQTQVGQIIHSFAIRIRNLSFAIRDTSNSVEL